MNKSKLVGVASSLLMLLFVYTASSKLFDLNTFRDNMYNQRIPHWLASLIIWTIPPAEMAIVVCLLFKRTQRSGFYLSLILLSIYTSYIAAILLHFFPKTPCSCGGVLRQMSWQQHLWFNLSFLILTILALAFDGKRPPPSNHSFFHH
jgi:hypothetical protein